MKKIIVNRFKVVHIPILFLFKIKDLKKVYRFKATHWTDGNTTIKYKHKDSLHWYDLGFNGNLYSYEDLEYNLKELIGEIDER
jgi:hypothetical protein